MLLLPSLVSSAELGRSRRGCFDSRISLRLSRLSPDPAPVKTLMSPCEMCRGWRGTRVAEGQGLPGPWAGLHRDEIPAHLCQLTATPRGKPSLSAETGSVPPVPLCPSPLCLVCLPKTLGISSSRLGEAGGALAMPADVDLLSLSSRN